MKIKMTRIERLPIRLEPVKVGYRQEDELSAVACAGTVRVRRETT